MAVVGAVIAIAATYWGLTFTPLTQPWVIGGTAVLAALYIIAVVQFLVWKTADEKVGELEKRLERKLKLSCRIETTNTGSGTEAHYVQVGVSTEGELPIYGCIPHITKIEHREAENVGFLEIYSESLRIAWPWDPNSEVVVASGLIKRFNVTHFFAGKDQMQPEVNPAPNKLLQEYGKRGKSGQYRFRVHIGARDVVPVEAHVYVKWRRQDSLPEVSLVSPIPEDKNDA